MTAAAIQPALRPASTRELAGLVRDAHDRHAALKIAGRGAWRVRSDAIAAHATTVDLSALTGIVEYVPGDLTLTARAGTTLGELDEVTRAHAQWCPLMPWGSDEGTLGATFATATRGPCSDVLGSPRDIAIGVEFVDGTGTTVRAGGRVVKNVAGFDLTRLLVGSWGTLGAIAEVSVRLRARPAVDESWHLLFDSADAAAQARLDAFRRGPLAPLAAEELTAAHARELGLRPAGEGTALVVRLGGNAAFVAASRAAVAAIGTAVQCDAALWTALRALDPHPLAPLTSNAIRDPLSQRVKKQFDPRHILNPGIMGEDVR